MLDGGTTTLELARALSHDLRANVVTTSPPIALALADHPGLEVTVVGGTLRPNALVTVGATAIDALRVIRADIVFLGVCGLHPEIGVTTEDIEERHVKAAMIEGAAEVVALADHDKLGTAMPVVVAPLTRGYAPGHRRSRRRRCPRSVPSAGDRGAARVSARAGITAVFFVNGALFASWASRIPALSDRVGATAGVLGLALLAPAVGAVIAMPVVGRLLPGRSSRSFCRLAVAGLMAAILLPATARSVPALAGALLVVGLGELDARPRHERARGVDRAPDGPADPLLAARRVLVRRLRRRRDSGRWRPRSTSRRSPTSPPPHCCSAFPGCSRRGCCWPPTRTPTPMRRT